MEFGQAINSKSKKCERTTFFFVYIMIGISSTNGSRLRPRTDSQSIEKVCLFHRAGSKRQWKQRLVKIFALGLMKTAKSNHYLRNNNVIEWAIRASPIHQSDGLLWSFNKCSTAGGFVHHLYQFSAHFVVFLLGSNSPTNEVPGNSFF